MSFQDKYEPKYPQNQKECDLYCERLVNGLKRNFADELVCVLLSGSWATGEAKPPKSDIDLTVVFRDVSGEFMKRVNKAWKKLNVGYVNIYDLKQVEAMSHEALHMYTQNALLLYGENPFPAPTRADFAQDLATSTEMTARMVRNLLYADWMTEKEVKGNLQYIFSKNCLFRNLQNLAAFRTGIFPRQKNDYLKSLEGYAEFEFLSEISKMSIEQIYQDLEKILLTLNQFCCDWFEELQKYKKGKN